MLEYSLIEADAPGEFTEAVTAAMLDGWQCQGGACVWFEPEDRLAPASVHYAQALVRSLRL